MLLIDILKYFYHMQHDVEWSLNLRSPDTYFCVCVVEMVKLYSLSSLGEDNT